MSQDHLLFDNNSLMLGFIPLLLLLLWLRTPSQLHDEWPLVPVHLLISGRIRLFWAHCSFFNHQDSCLIKKYEMLAIITGFLSLLNFVSFSLKFGSLLLTSVVYSLSRPALDCWQPLSTLHFTDSTVIFTLSTVTTALWNPWTVPHHWNSHWIPLQHLLFYFSWTEWRNGCTAFAFAFFIQMLDSGYIHFPTLQDQEGSVFQNSVTLFFSIPVVPFLYILWSVDT